MKPSHLNVPLGDWILTQNGQIGPKWDKSGTFQDQFQYILALQISQICPIWGQSDPIWMPNLTSLLLTQLTGLANIFSSEKLQNYFKISCLIHIGASISYNFINLAILSLSGISMFIFDKEVIDRRKSKQINKHAMTVMNHRLRLFRENQIETLFRV